MTDKKDLTFNKLRAKKFASLAEEMQNKCPGLSRYYMFKAQKISQNSSDPLSNSWKSNWCIWCGSFYSPENIKVRLVPKIPQTSNLRKLLKKYFTNPQSLGKYQGHRIARYLDTKNKLTITCQVCKKKRKIEGRERIVQLSKTQSTPGSVTMSNSLSKMVKIRLKKKQKKTPSVTNISSSDSPLLTSTPSMGNLSMSSNNSKWESDSTPLTSTYQRNTPGSQRNTPGSQRNTPGSQRNTPSSLTNTPNIQRKNSKKVNHLKRLLYEQKTESEDSLMNFLQSVS